MTDASFRFRIATPDDAPALLAIYAPYVENTAISFEYAVPSVEEFRSRIEGVRKSYPYLVAEAADGSLLGYAYTHTFIPRAAYDHCAETTIYLALDARHQGLGKRLYRALEEFSLAQNIYNLYACIGEPQGEGDEYLTDNSIRFTNIWASAASAFLRAAATSSAAGTICRGQKSCCAIPRKLPRRSFPFPNSIKRSLRRSSFGPASDTCIKETSSMKEIRYPLAPSQSGRTHNAAKTQIV